MYKKRSLLSKLWLKHTNHVAYKEYKWEMQNYSKEQFFNFFTGSARLNTIEKIAAIAGHTSQLNVNHSGNAGDIIYALPTIKKITEETGVAINLFLTLGKPLGILDQAGHPLGNVMLNQTMFDMLKPLILSQPYISSFEVFNDQQIHIDLDFFRMGLVPLDRGNIARWCGYVTGVTPELTKPWLHVEPNLSYKNQVVLARSARYRNRGISYSFLTKYDVVFVGIESEFKDMKAVIPNLQWSPVTDFKQLAQIIAGSKLFIGNQSFPFSIAEGLKVPRVLETAFDVINVVPEGDNAHDFFFQEHFESIVNKLFNN